MIIDASVVFKWLAQEEGSEAALALVGREPLVAPTRLLSEIGNALWKQARRDQLDPAVSFESDLAGLAKVIAIRDEIACVPRALSIARRLDHPVYDCVYLAMAEMEADRMITADRRFFAKARDSEWAGLIEMLV